MLNISIVQHQQGRFSTELEHRWFQILSAGAGDNAPHRCGAGKVNAPHRRVGDQRFHQRRRIFRRTGKIVHHARREARRVKGVDNQSLSGGGKFGALKDHRVATGQRRRQGPGGQNQRRVPRRHAQHHSRPLADAHRQVTRHVGRNYLPFNLGGQRRRFTQNICRQMNVKSGPVRGRAGLRRHGGDKFRLPQQHLFRRFEQ